MRRLTWFNTTSLTLGFAFLYLPMVILVIYSFNSSKLVTVWAGFSTKWYGELMRNEAFLDAAWVTIKVAVLSSTFATVLGTLAAYVLVRAGSVLGADIVLWDDLCASRDARGDHRPIPSAAIYWHWSGSRRHDNRFGPHHLFDVLRVCGCVIAPCHL